MKSHYGNDEYPFLTYKDPLSRIWMVEVHREDHAGISRTVAKLGENSGPHVLGD